MAAVLHLFKGGDPDLVRVAVALLHGAALSMLPAGVRVQRVPDELSWDALLEQIFAADQVVTW